MELKIFRDTLPQGGAGCTVKAELPLETEIRISDDLPPVGKLVKCFVHPVVVARWICRSASSRHGPCRWKVRPNI